MSDRARTHMQISADLAGTKGVRRRDLLRGGLGAAGLVGAAGLIGLAGSGLLLPGTTLAQDLRFFQIGTGTTGGTYFLIGGLLANAISNPPGSRPCDRGGSCGVPGLIVVAQSTSGAVENVLAMREGRLESGLVQADIAYAAYLGRGVFDDAPPAEALRSIANLYLETIHLVVRADSGIDTVADLKGRSVALGEKGSGTLVSARALLNAYKLSEKTVKPVYLSPGTASDRLAAGEIDAFFIIGGYPLPAVADLAQRVPIRLIPFDDEQTEELEKRLPLFTEARIEAESYQGVPAIRTLGVGAQWIVRGDIDADLVYGITQALWHPTTGKLLAASHPRAAAIQLDQALAGLAVPLHPGAERFYREAGLITETAEVVSAVEMPATPPSAPIVPAMAPPARKPGP